MLDFNKIISFLNQLAYKLGVDPAKERDITALAFWYKELFHFTGGLLLGLPAYFCNWCFLGIIPLLAYLIYSELGDINTGQPWYKAVLDISAWIIGFCLPFIISKL